MKLVFFDYSVIIAHPTHFRENLVPLQKPAQEHKKRGHKTLCIFNS